MNLTVQQLEEAAGGEDALVKRLLELRQEEKTPFVGIRAEKLLLGYAGRSDVRAALESDLKSDQLLGLARIVAVNVDKIEDAETRASLARIAIERGEQDESFRSYAKTLTASADTTVSTMAREAFGG